MCVGGGGGQEGLLPLLRFVCKHVTHQAYAGLMTDTAHLILELYTVSLLSWACADATLVWGRSKQSLGCHPCTVNQNS